MRTSAHCAILRVKSPPHLEPWDIQRFLERGVAAKRRENASAPQNGISSQTQQGIPPQDFQNHIPARGRKPVYERGDDRRTLFFQNHIPARGRKRSSQCGCLSRVYLFKTISPQGDGNSLAAGNDLSISAAFQNHIPARGRKRHQPEQSRDSNDFQNHIPARGRKRVGHQSMVVQKQLFKTISPQGDGNSSLL